MNIIFLDIDGVLNNCNGRVMHESAIIPECINNLNSIININN